MFLATRQFVSGGLRGSVSSLRPSKQSEGFPPSRTRVERGLAAPPEAKIWIYPGCEPGEGGVVGARYISGIIQQQHGFQPLFIATTCIYLLALRLIWINFHWLERNVMTGNPGDMNLAMLEILNQAAFFVSS